jgi:hypothetical protein
MAFDGQAETEALLTIMATLVGGRIHEALPDDTVLPTMDDGSGRVKPYIVVLTSDPIPKAGDRSLMGERDQAHVLPISIVSIAGDPKTVRDVSAGVVNLLLERALTPSSSPLVGSGGYSFTEPAPELKPSRFVRTRQFTCDINLSGE